MGWHKNIIRRPDFLGVVALGVVYLVWGSTYLAIREAVRGDGAIAPLALGAARMGLASAILFGLAGLRGERLKLGARGLARAATIGGLLWLGGNGLVVVGLTTVDSGLAAVLMATTPMWLAIFTAVKAKRLPSRKIAVGLALGLCGVAVLIASGHSTGGGSSASGVALILIAAMSWALGSMLRQPGGSPLVNAATIMWFAAIGFAIASAACGESLAIPSTRAIAALGYLVVVGSAIGFVAYLIATERLPLQLVMTHAQVNPLVAVVLGAAFAGESISRFTAVAGALIIASVPLSRG